MTGITLATGAHAVRRMGRPGCLSELELNKLLLNYSGFSLRPASKQVTHPRDCPGDHSWQHECEPGESPQCR